jgi:2'-5' RNA ligase
LSDNESRRRRLFFALWPDETTRKAIAKFARNFPRRHGRPVPSPNLHITLAFVGAVDTTVHERLRAWAAAIEADRFLLRLTQVGYFPRTRILWLGAACPAALTFLVRQLNEGLELCGFRPDLRPYRPHVTLLRDAGPAPATYEVAPIHWQVDQFYLMESHTRPEGARYEILQGFELRA